MSHVMSANEKTIAIKAIGPTLIIWITMSPNKVFGISISLWTKGNIISIVFLWFRNLFIHLLINYKNI